jgi:hypothetical protein
MSVLTLFVCFLAAILTALGENTPVVNGRELRGIEGVFVCLAAFPFSALVVTFIATIAVYSGRRKMRAR